VRKLFSPCGKTARQNACFLTEVTENTKWHCKFEVTKTSNGNTNTKFLSAFLTKNSSENNDFFAKKFFFLMIKKAFPRCFVADLFVENLSFSNEKIFTCRDKNCSFRYEICKELNGNWQIKRTKLNDKKERDAIIIIDNVSFDVVSKNYI
jgi:hypothetical protein